MSSVQAFNPRGSAPAAHHRGFTSFKCRQAIQYTRRCCRDALIQATLDPDVTEIFPYSVSTAPRDAFFTVGLKIGEQFCALALCDQTDRTTFPVPAEFDLGICANRDSVQSEPVLTTTRTIWSTRDLQVPPLFAVRLLRHLATAGPNVTLGQLDRAFGNGHANWLDLVMAMACKGSISFDCRHPLTEETVVAQVSAQTRQQSSGHWLYR